MKAALLIVLSLSALALAGPAFNKDAIQQQQQNSIISGAEPKGPVVDILKQWCFSSQMNPQELTSSFKKLVQVVKSNPTDQTIESAVMSGRICQNADLKSSQDKTDKVDTQAHELIKDVYMDSLISCKSRDCTQQLLKIVNSNKVDTVRASYYMTRLAVTEKDDIKDESEIKQLAESFIQSIDSVQSESIERQKLFATTALIGKWIQAKPTDSSIKQTAEQVAKTIVDRYVKPVTEQEVQQYQQQQQSSSNINEQLVKKIAKRSAALKALANIPGHVLKQCSDVTEVIVSICNNKQELVTVRQSAIECLEQNDQALTILKQLTFDQEEPIEVRVAAYRALMTVAYAGENKNESAKQQLASQIVDQVVKHCEQSRNQQQDDQFVLYAISHLDNVRTSQQPEHQAIKQVIVSNKQHYMQIQVLCNKFKQQLGDIRRSSRNYKLEQEFNQLESGLIVEGDLIYESKNKQQQQQQQQQILPKVVRVNMSMPVMGETVNVVEITVRQNAMDEEILSALNLVGSGKSFSSQSMSRVVDSFKSSVEKQQTKDYSNTNKQQPTEADLTIKVDGCTIIYLCVDDFKTTTAMTGLFRNNQQQQHQRNTRSVYSNSIVDDVIEYLKRQPIAFNRGFNFNLNERIAKVLDVDANIIAGLRFESHATGQSKDNFEIVAQMEPRFNFEAIVGPAKMTNKKLLQRLSTKTALGLKLRFKKDELVDIQVDMPMNTMDLFTVETQIVEKSSRVNNKSSDIYELDSYSYLPESIYGQEDIYSTSYPANVVDYYTSNKIAKRSIFSSEKKFTFGKIFTGYNVNRVSRVLEIPEEIARAVGLKGKLTLAASPKDLSLFLSAVVEKYEPQIQGFRVQVQKMDRSHDQKSYVITFTTPNSRLDRTVQLRVVKQSSPQRTLIKTEVQSAKIQTSLVTEIVHDGRQYSAKTEIVSRSPVSQWRHVAEVGVISASSARAAFAYKPYVNIESSALKRPIQMSGSIAYQQTPKSVISYELRCQTSGDYIQGKIIVDQRDSSSGALSMSKRSSYSVRRAMQSPLELLLKKDLTLTSELLAQVNEHALKVHNMIDWNCDKYSVQADYSASYKNLRNPSHESHVSAQMKFDDAQQVLTVERKNPQQERNDFRLQLASQVKSASSHQMIAELRYNGRRQSTLAYKHQIDFQKVSGNKYECQALVELVDSEHKLNEKLTGRARITNERRNKSIDCELSSRQNYAKINFDFESLAQHQLVVVAKTERFAHKTELRNNHRQFSVQSSTNKQGQMVAKLIAELAKEQPMECKLVLEIPAKRSHLAVDVKLASGKLSSIALQTPRFATKGEFSFETISRPYSSILKPFTNQNWRFKTNHKDLINKEAYWMDSSLNLAELNKRPSFVRLDSPIYRTDLEFDPTDFSTKMGLFARSKRSVDSFDTIYSNKDSAVSQLMDKLNLNTNSNKLWMLRSIVSSPYAMDSLKQKARRALFEFADRRQSHRHSIDYSPAEERVNFMFEHEPAIGQSAFQPRRLTGDLSTSWSRPSRMSLESDWMNCDVEAKPFDGEESFAKVSALSRHPRSAFKKHDSEYRYKKDQGYKAWMKHQDSEDKHHEMRVESDESPKKFAKLQYESDKHGKASYEHKWRKYANKRSIDQEDVWANKMLFERSLPDNKMVHRSIFAWEEPIKMIESRRGLSSGIRRERRHVADSYYTNKYASPIYSAIAGLKRTDLFERYAPLEYLKHTSARLNSETTFDNNNNNAYKVDFDYQPQMSQARLNVNMPDDLLHASSLEYKPTERLYKMQSKLYNQRTQEPIYDLYYTTKPVVAVDGLATADQEPVFINSEHPMLEQPISRSLLSNVFKQPMKLDYSDKYGRVASFDYDHSPLSLAKKYDNLRQKRAAVYYKDDVNDFEHQTTYDFYPETSFLGKLKPQYSRQSGDVVFKTSTKYGPIVVRADSADTNKDAMNVDIQTPVMNIKLVADEQSRSNLKLYKVQLDNKSQKVELSKLVRKSPVEWVRNSELVKKVARKVDSSRFEHDTECLVSIIDAIFKIKSSTKLDERQVLTIEAELDQDQNKAFAKINGERVRGQLVADLLTKSADLVLDVDNKRTLAHESRLVRTSDKLYTLQSATSYKSKPLFKLTGKICSLIFEEPSHLFSTATRTTSTRRVSAGRIDSCQPHMSTFEAVLYEPNEYHITGQYDCMKKEARVVFKNVDENQTQETIVKFEEQNEDLIVNSRLSSPEGEIYVAKAKVNLPGIVSDITKDQRCQYKPESCRSEMIYSNYSEGEQWVAKHLPGKFVSIESPRTGRQTFQLSY